MGKAETLSALRTTRMRATAATAPAARCSLGTYRRTACGSPSTVSPVASARLAQNSAATFAYCT